MNKTDNIIYKFLSVENSVDRDTISKSLSLPRTTVYDALLRLRLNGLVEVIFAKNQKGRPKVMYRKCKVV